MSTIDRRPCAPEKTHQIYNTRTRAVVLEGTQAQCLSAAQAWSANVAAGTFRTEPLGAHLAQQTHAQEPEDPDPVVQRPRQR